MFVGHYGVAFAARRVGGRVPLWVWFVSVQWMDVVWSVLVLLGIEKLRIVPGFTEANALDLYYMPYTHGLPGAIVVSLVLGAIVALLTPGNRARICLLVAAASFSHWVLDLVVHVPDLPLYDNAAKVGLGLWRHVGLSFSLELIVLGLGAWLYARRTTFASARGRYVLSAFVILLAAVQAIANFGPPPSSPHAMAVTALAFYAVLALLAAWVERIAKRGGSGRRRPRRSSCSPPPSARVVTASFGVAAATPQAGRNRTEAAGAESGLAGS